MYIWLLKAGKKRLAQKFNFTCRLSDDVLSLSNKTISEFPGCLRLGLSWFNWWVSFAPEFQCCYFCKSSCLFYLSFNSDFYVSKIMHL